MRAKPASRTCSRLVCRLCSIETKHLYDIDNELERAVFLVQYRSLRQRGLRLAATLLIVARHGLRGLLYVWPLSILLLVDLPGAWNALRLLLVGLAVAAWFRFIYGSVRDDYARFVGGTLLEYEALRRVL